MERNILYLLITLLFPLIILILGFVDNTEEFSYPFILGFGLALILYFKFDKKEVENNKDFE